MEEANKEILKKGNAAIAAGDNEGFLSLCSDDTLWIFVGDRILRGKEEVRQYLTATYREPPRFTVTGMIAEGDFVTALGEIVLKDDSGKECHYSYCDVWRFRDGKMTELRAYVIETTA